MINKVILVGNVGADPEVRSLEGGVKVARLRLATTERIYNRQTQEAKEHTEWHSITLWRGLAETADRFVKKGSRIYIEGRLRSREWSDEAGNRRSAVEIVEDELKLLDRRSDAPAEGGSPSAGNYAQGAAQSSGFSAPTAPVTGATAAPTAASAATPPTPATSAPASEPQPAQPSSPPMNDPDDLPF